MVVDNLDFSVTFFLGGFRTAGTALFRMRQIRPVQVVSVTLADSEHPPARRAMLHRPLFILQASGNGAVERLEARHPYRTSGRSALDALLGVPARGGSTTWSFDHSSATEVVATIFFGS